MEMEKERVYTRLDNQGNPRTGYKSGFGDIPDLLYTNQSLIDAEFRDEDFIDFPKPTPKDKRAKKPSPTSMCDEDYARAWEEHRSHLHELDVYREFEYIRKDFQFIVSCFSELCTSYSLKPTTIPLAPPLAEVNGEVLKTLADRTVPFLHGWPIPVSPQEISPTLIVGYLPIGVGWAGTQNLPPLFQGVFIRNGNGYNHAFQDRFVYNISELQFLQKHLRCFCYRTGISLAHIIVPRPSLRVRALATP